MQAGDDAPRARAGAAVPRAGVLHGRAGGELPGRRAVDRHAGARARAHTLTPLPAGVRPPVLAHTIATAGARSAWKRALHLSAPACLQAAHVCLTRARCARCAARGRPASLPCVPGWGGSGHPSARPRAGACGGGAGRRARLPDRAGRDRGARAAHRGAVRTAQAPAARGPRSSPRREPEPSPAAQPGSAGRRRGRAQQVAGAGACSRTT